MTYAVCLQLNTLESKVSDTCQCSQGTARRLDKVGHGRSGCIDLRIVGNRFEPFPTIH